MLISFLYRYLQSLSSSSSTSLASSLLLALWATFCTANTASHLVLPCYLELLHYIVNYTRKQHLPFLSSNGVWGFKPGVWGDMAPGDCKLFPPVDPSGNALLALSKSSGLFLDMAFGTSVMSLSSIPSSCICFARFSAADRNWIGEESASTNSASDCKWSHFSHNQLI